jgi:hypothetical protein
VKRFVLTPTRLAWAVLVTGVATRGIVWVAIYKSLTLQGRMLLFGLPGGGAHEHLPAALYASPIWTAPVAALISISAVGAVFLILRRR